MTDILDGMHVGIVVQNNDPDHSGRVKIYVPHLHDIYENWYKDKTDKSFTFPGKNIDSDLEQIMNQLKVDLPWAEQASPCLNQSAVGRYNCEERIGTISDSNVKEYLTEDDNYTPSEFAVNDTGIGEKPGYQFETEKLLLKDGFTKSDHKDLRSPKNANQCGYNYKPSTYSNLPKGEFGVPNVGSHVWVFFKKDHVSGLDRINHPVYFASTFSKTAWNDIYDCSDSPGLDYPGAYENMSSEEMGNVVDDTYRSKYVLNQKGGTIEIVSTDLRESLKLTHYTGSYIGMNNHTNTELAVNNHQTLVLKDQFLTVNGSRNIITERDLDVIIRGDRYKRVGNMNVDAHEQWKRLVYELSYTKGLFDIMRANPDEEDMFVSPLQTKSGSHAPCPVCDPSSPRANTLYHINNSFGSVGIPKRKSAVDEPPARGTISWSKRDQASRTKPGEVGTIFGEVCPVCNGTGLSPSTMDGNWILDPKKADNEWKTQIKNVQHNLLNVERELGIGGSEYINITKHKTETIGLVMNDFQSIRVDKIGKMSRSGVKILKQGVINDYKPTPLIEYVHVDDLPGGTYNMNVTNRWNIQVGSGGVSMKTSGPVDIGGTITNIAGSQVNIGSKNEINIDGGRRLELVADVVTIRQRTNGQVLIDSNLGVSQNVVVAGGMHVEGELSVQHVTAPVEIQETEKTELWGEPAKEKKIIGYLDDGVPVKMAVNPLYEGKAGDFLAMRDNKGKIVQGGQDGVPPTPIYSALGWDDGYASMGGGGPISATTGLAESFVGDTDSIRTYPHSHHFKNIPLHLKNTNEGVRESGKSCHFSKRRRAEHPDFRMAKDKST